ncbi:hypothetical protein C9F11_16460 [Streptomyces sp. YIM 121038]|uniref:hypothetical protein n=1 Tax=Streptomyces sp. YIM 121038 TaxID=2136401 RepID=UPI0011108D52|nr:hypothetical protein [Streptomyces sp. YIM 121038]QCX76952.1 hypothetical protein C9F11_16460 [Streptomyces sp. YIM 121038]
MQTFLARGLARRARQATRRARFRVERATAGRQRQGDGELLGPVHLSLRDSRTLNVALSAPGPARLLISRGPRRFRVPLVLEAETALLTATVSLRDAAEDARGAGPVLGEGVWRLTVETTGADGRVRRQGLALADAPGPPGPTLPHAPHPRTGTLLRLVRCRGGRAAVQVTRSRPRAELVRFEPRGDGITVHGRMVAARAAQRASAVRRRDGLAVPVRPEWDGDRFRFALPLAAMAGAGPGQWVWDFRVGELPLGRWLTDVRDLPSAFPTPFRLVALEGGGLVRAHPHVTASGAFAVTCLDLGRGLEQKETS